MTYQAGDTITIDDTTVILGTRKGASGVRWNWYAPAIELGGEAYYPTPEQAIESAHRTIGGPICPCGNAATMVSGTRRGCVDCFDRRTA